MKPLDFLDPQSDERRFKRSGVHLVRVWRSGRRWIIPLFWGVRFAVIPQTLPGLRIRTTVAVFLSEWAFSNCRTGLWFCKLLRGFGILTADR